MLPPPDCCPPVQAVKTARTTTQVVDGFTVLYSKSEGGACPACDTVAVEHSCQRGASCSAQCQWKLSRPLAS